MPLLTAQEWDSPTGMRTWIWRTFRVAVALKSWLPNGHTVDVQAIQMWHWRKHRSTKPYALRHTSVRRLVFLGLHLNSFPFPAETFQNKPIIYCNLSQSKTHTDSLYGLPANTDKFLRLFNSGCPLVWPGGTDPEPRLGRLKQNVNDLRCSFITKHFSCLSMALCPFPSLSPTSVISGEEGGKVIRHKWGGVSS